MEFKKISETDFETLKGNRGYRKVEQQGSLNGDLNDFLLFLNWTLETNHNNNSEHLKEAIKTFSDKYKMSMTTQFLKNQMRRNFPNKTARIGYLLDGCGMTTTPINRYFYSVMNAKMKLREYGTERTYDVGHTYQRLNKEQMDLLIDKQENEKHLADIKFNFEELAKKKEKKKKDNKPEPPQPEVEIEEPGIEVKCQKCSKTIKLPLLDDIEHNKEQEMVYGIYSCFINKLENGTGFCNACQLKMEQEGLWKTEDIKKWLNENKGSCFEVSTEDFCNEFRNDKKMLAGTTIKYKLESMDLPVECRTSGTSIRIKL